MHTLIVIGAGLALLTAFVLLGRGRLGAGRAALAFVPVWLLAAGVNMWVGVTSAGYTVAAEAPIFLLVFGLPALVALLVRWRTG